MYEVDNRKLVAELKGIETEEFLEAVKRVMQECSEPLSRQQIIDEITHEVLRRTNIMTPKTDRQTTPRTERIYYLYSQEELTLLIDLIDERLKLADHLGVPVPTKLISMRSEFDSGIRWLENQKGAQ